MTLKTKHLGIALLLTTLIFPALVHGEESKLLPDQQAREGYSIGVDLVRNMKRQGIVTNYDALLQGVGDALKGEQLLLNEEELHQALNSFQTALKQKRARTTRVVALDNKKEGEAFLARNKALPGVVTLPSGVQYKVLKEGKGRKPTESDTVVVNYIGTFVDGSEFDNSYHRGKPASFKVKGVIPGWTEALQLMPLDSKWQIVIPSQLAYGEKGSGRSVGPNETLIFEVELVSIK